MESNNAKYILRSIRPNGKDDADPQFREALETATTDETLGAWLVNEHAASRALSEKLSEIPVPHDLRAKILAGARCSSPTRRSRTPQWLAIAALVIISTASIFLWSNQPTWSGPKTFAAFQVDMSSYLESFFLLDLQTDNLDEVRDWLASKHGFTDYEIPAALAAHPSVGCEIIDWHDAKIALICFDVNGELVHLFVSPDNSFPGAGETTVPNVKMAGKWACADWHENEKNYLVLTQGTESFLNETMQL